MGSTTTLKFATLNKSFTRSVHPIIISIFDDTSQEPTECLICNIQAGMVQSVRIVAPERVTICIFDDDGKKAKNMDSAVLGYYKGVTHTTYIATYVTLVAPSNITYIKGT